MPNEAVLLRAQENPKNTCLARPIGLHEGGMRATLGPFRSPNDAIMGVAPRNLEQRIALEMLLDRDVRLVTLVGKAGTGKTLLALVAGLSLVTRKHHYAKMLVARPIMPLGKDIGFLPGKVSEKLEPWMKPIFDNLQFVLRTKGRKPAEAKQKVQDLISSGLIEMEALTYIRGRSLPNQYLIVDEAQNLTPHEVKTVITRAGQNTKIVLTGDPLSVYTNVAETWVMGELLFDASDPEDLLHATGGYGAGNPQMNTHVLEREAHMLEGAQ